jgi:hypothetical protein
MKKDKQYKGDLVDKILFNRLLSIITSFIVAILKLIPKDDLDIIPKPPTPLKPDHKPWFPWIRKTLNIDKK